MAAGHEDLSNAFSRAKKYVNVIPEDGVDLSLLTIIYCELLSSNSQEKELGPKGSLGLMSRRSFSDMYANLAPKDKETFAEIMKSYSLNKPNKNHLFYDLYPLNYGVDICRLQNSDKTVTHCQKEAKEVTSTIRNIKINDFIESIISPESSKAFIGKNNDILSKTLKCLLEDKAIKQNKESMVNVIKELKNIESGMFNFQGKDILSPPPFLRNTYSMGKQKTIISRDAILEMRGYSTTYHSRIPMGKPISMWLSREMDNAGKEWSDQDKIMTAFTEFRVTSVEGYNSCKKTKTKVHTLAR
jgi:hypothetical protein